MDLRTVERLRDRVDLMGREPRPQLVARKKARKQRPVEFVQAYQQWILREKQFLCLNKYARESAQKAAKARSLAPSPHMLHPPPLPPDQSILQIRRHLRTLTGMPVKPKTLKHRVHGRPQERELLTLAKKEINTNELWRSTLPELTAERYGYYRPKALRKGQNKGNYSPGTLAEADTQTPEPVHQALTFRAVQVSRLSSRGWGDQGLDLEHCTC